MTHLAALLPVRLETRFLPPGHTAEHPASPTDGAPTTWRLRLRVVPETLSLDCHDPAVTLAEKQGVAALWQSLVTRPDPADPAVSARAAATDEGWPDAFSRLVAQVGPGRAAWLVRSVPVRADGGSFEVADAVADAVPRTSSSIVAGFPAGVDVWVVWDDPASLSPEVLHTLHPDRTVLETPAQGVPEWLVSWEAAQEAGMAVQIELHRHPERIRVLGVSGLTDDDPHALVALMASHAAAGALSLTGPGAATSIVHGAPVLPTGTDPQGWPAMGSPTSSLVQRTLAALVGAQTAATLDVRARGEDTLDRDLVRATFPALWGYAWAGVLGAVDPLELPRLWDWATQWLRPQGSYATLVVDGAAYGVLPVVDPGRLSAAGVGEFLAPMEALLGPLGEAITAWGGAAEVDTGAVGGGVADVVRTLRRGPVPGAFGSAGFRAVDLLAAITTGDVEEARRGWDYEHRRSIDVLGAMNGRRYWASGERTRQLRIPLIVPTTEELNADPSDAVETFVTGLKQWRHEWLFEPVDLGFGPVQAVHAHRELAASGFHVDRGHASTLLGRLFERSLSVAGVSLDLLRHAIGLPLDPQWEEPSPGLLERLVLRGESTHARHHLNAVARVLRDNGLDGTWALGDAQLAENLTWLADTGFDLMCDLPRACLDDPDTSQRLHRAFRALLETASGRWDPWWDAVGAAHVSHVQELNSAPATAGVQGWIDFPFRGRPGPGPGGVVLAPSLAHAATGAALRDRAVHDDGRWALRRDSATVGPARALLADIAQGWHPAEVVGRMIEHHVVESAAPPGTIGSKELVALRTAFPLRTAQGHFGCCHGLRVLDAGAAALPEIGPPGTVAAAVAAVRDILDCAADLLVAESVHGVLAGRPERAAVATEALAGQLSAGPLDVLGAHHPGRSVRTLVLAALPRTDPPPDATGALAAAPALDAAIQAATPGLGWTASFSSPSGPVSVALADLGLSALHTTLLDEDALARLAAVRAGMLGMALDGPQEDAPPVASTAPVAGAPVARALGSAIGGRAPDPAELRPPGSHDSATSATIDAARTAAAAAWAARLTALSQQADALANTVEATATEARAAWRQALAEGSDPTGHGGLATHVLELAAWGIGPDAEVPWLFSTHPQRRDAGLAATLCLLERGAQILRSRAAAARSGGGGAAALAELGAGRLLPVGTPGSLALLGEPLRPAAGTATLGDWLPAVAQVRPTLAPLTALLDVHGLAWRAVDPDDPWRVAALASPASETSGMLPPADPRLTVVVDCGSTASEDREFVVIDSYAENIPDPEPDLGLAFDAATPSAVPPQAILLVPSPDPAVPLGAADLPTAVLLARTMGHARMASTVTLREAGLGPLAAACMLPQDGDTGCPFGSPHKLPRHDNPAGLVPLPTRDDTTDVVAATTADAAWMLGVQWRLGEHLGEDAASPTEVEVAVTSEPIAEPLLASRAPEAVVESAGWDPETLVHTARWAALDGAAVAVQRHDAGPLDWWALVRSKPVRAGGPVSTQVRLPGRLRWPGQSRRRYWQVDDASLDPVGHGPDRAHPATLHLVDVISRLGDDWYRIPVTGRAGEFLRPTRVRLTDGAGGIWDLHTDADWSLFAVAGADPDAAGLPPGAIFHRALPILLGAGGALEGEPVEEMALAVDEDENVMWAALRRPTTQTDTAEDAVIPAVGQVATTDPLEVVWRLGGTSPGDRLPYLYGANVPPGAFGHGADLFVRAQLRDPRTGTLVDLPSSDLLSGAEGSPHVLRPLAVPSSGLRLVRRTVLARDVDGHPVRWWRSERLPLDVAVDVDMPWDLLAPLDT